MKKVTVLLLLTILSYVSINAQVTKFKVELGGLYCLPLDDAFKGGVGFYLHPSFYLTDQINVGIKAEGAIIGAADVEGVQASSISISAISSYLATFNYYFTVSKVRPYAGVGVGLYTLGTTSVNIDPNNALELDYGNKLGVAPKIGLDLGHFTINASYNYIIGQEEGWADKSYLAVGLGVFFGGGVKGKGSKKSKFITIDEDEDF